MDHNDTVRQVRFRANFNKVHACQSAPKAPVLPVTTASSPIILLLDDNQDNDFDTPPRVTACRKGVLCPHEGAHYLSGT